MGVQARDEGDGILRLGAGVGEWEGGVDDQSVGYGAFVAEDEEVLASSRGGSVVCHD